MNCNQIGFWLDGGNEITVKPNVLNGNNHTCRHAKNCNVVYFYAQIILLVDVVENELNDDCAGGKSVLQTGAPARVFGRPISVSDFVALNVNGIANGELGGMWKTTVVIHLRNCSGIGLKGLAKPHSYQKFSTSLQQTRL